MSDISVYQRTMQNGDPPGVTVGPVADDERPPSCPSCHRRLVILSTSWARDQHGNSRRNQLWGCPHGHATSQRIGGLFTPVELLPDVTR